MGSSFGSGGTMTTSTTDRRTYPAGDPTGVSAARRIPTAKWTDRRVVVGAMLTLGSLLGVVLLVNGTNHTTEVWVFRADLAPGSQVTPDDVELSPVKVPDVSRYLMASQSPVGSVTKSSVTTGELVSPRSLVGEDSVNTRLVTLPVERHHLPVDIQRGQAVDVYEVVRGTDGQPVGDPRLVLSAVTVAGVDDASSRFGGSSLEVGVVLTVPADDVSKLVAADAGGTLTLVRVPSETQ